MSHNKELQNFQAYQHSKKRKVKLWFFFGFVLVFMLLFYTSFYDSFSFTGNPISEKKGDISFKADLTSPSLKLQGNFPNIEIEGSSNSPIYIGNEKIELGDFDNYLVLENFEGKIYFDKTKIYLLKGDVGNIKINGITYSENGRNEIYLSSEMIYSSLEIDSGVFIDKLDYTASGSLRANENLINLDNERIIIEDYSGDFSSNRNKAKFDGIVSGLNIKGNSNINIHS